MKMLEQVAKQTETMEKKIEKGQEAFSKTKQRFRWIEESFHYSVREFRLRWTLRVIAVVVATLGLGAWLFAAYFQMTTTFSPAMSAFILGLVLVLGAGIMSIASLRRVRRWLA